jgi:hypothetical protein
LFVVFDPHECWGPLADAGARGRGGEGGGSSDADQRVSEDSIEAFSRARDLWAAVDDGGAELGRAGAGSGAAASAASAATRASATTSAAVVATSLDDVDSSKNSPQQQQRNGGGGGGGGGGMGPVAGGMELGASRARSFAKNGMGVSSSTAGVEDIDAMGSPVVKGVVSR